MRSDSFLASLICALTLLLSPVSSSAEQFVAGGTNPVGTQPRFVTLADLNGDHILDMAVADVGTNTISVLMGNGDGTFQPAVNYVVGSGPWMVVAADFNNDGHLDLASFVGSSHQAAVLMNNGDGTFKPVVTFTVGTNPIAIAAADLNHDGNQDLLVVNHSTNNVSVLLGNGNGTFQKAVNYAVGAKPRWVSVADFNGDANSTWSSPTPTTAQSASSWGMATELSARPPFTPPEPPISA